MIHDLSGKEKSALLGAAEIALVVMERGLMGDGVEAPRVPQPGLDYLKARGDIRPEDRPLSVEENAGPAVSDPFNETGCIAAGKKLCGMCGHKAAKKGEWFCTFHGTWGRYPCPAENDCPGFLKKPSVPRPPQPKQKGLPVPEGVKFLYIGAPPKGRYLDFRRRVPVSQGVVTVAWIEPSPGVLHLGFSFCSPKDRWCKITGRDMALERLLYPEVVIPFLYFPKRTVHEVTRAMLTHDFGRIAALAPGVTMFGAVPSWTRGLGKRMEEKEKMVGGRIKRLRVPSLPDFLGGFYIAPPTRDLPFNITAHIMADIVKQGID